MYLFLDAFEIRPLIDENIELDTITVIDGPNGSATEWEIAGEVTKFETTPNQDHTINIEEVFEDGKLIMKRSLPFKKRIFSNIILYSISYK